MKTLWTARNYGFLVALAAGACDDDQPAGDDDQPAGHEGEPCGTFDVAQACGDGIELCPGNVWSACFDACSEVGATRACTTEANTPGVERCVVTPAPGLPPFWGTCAPDECEPGEDVPCSSGEGANECRMDAYGASYEYDDGISGCSTPLVLAFAARDPVFTAPQSGASFDISSTNTCTTPDWPTAATPWLARDLDRSGSIDGGHELFGNGTILPSGDHARHGFAALASVDSNLDGAITPADLAWPELLLWSDYDSDRRSTGWELLPLHAHGVAAISLDYHLAPVCDARGNCSRERAAFTLNHNTSQAHGEVIDVYLRCE
ncbi:hypothetical protein [Nannocystis sp.]|uniref:hypothetical protein n=1 Tax=Nannocystis sp. TaxID=1962667 RepID=UPI0025CFE5D7|nr:hypothetical protein [Nannocystis sp.]MBK7827678.1 hypothetical protein [Nannocystis sp.]